VLIIKDMNMFRKNFIPLAALALIIFVTACSSKKEEHHDDHESEGITSDHWKEMDDFHMVMAEAFHPYKDSANLEPARQNATALVESADKWSQATLPSKFEGDDEIKFKLSQLKKDAATFADVAQTGDDKAVAESLTKLHDLFHEIQESWYGGHSEEGH
jgi:hypothetical protein